MSLEQLAAVGVAGAVLIGVGAIVVARRRHAAAVEARASAASRRRARVELQEDPIVASLARGGERGDRRR